MKIAVIGAGFAGLSTAKILKALGHEVTVYEKDREVGGVWAASRRYPGLTTQNVRSTYALSDFPYPSDYPEWPSGEQVQRYLAAYAQKFELGTLIHLQTEVTRAEASTDGPGWQLAYVDLATGQPGQRSFDYLVVCNGTFSQPMVPDFDGAAEFQAAGGVVCHSSNWPGDASVKGRHVLVVGYGKSSCDLAQAVSGAAASTTVVVRQLIWKMPKKLFNVLNYKYLLLTRMGEALFEYIRVTGFERFLHGPGKPVRNSLLSQVQWVVTVQCKLKALGLLPSIPFETISRSTVSLVTDGFFESVAAGKIRVCRDAVIRRLLAGPAGRFAELSTGERVPADMVVCATGWQQRVPFLSDAVMASVTDAKGNFRLYRSILPVHVPRLAFNGYNSSLFSQLSCEVGALWIADLLGGQLKMPTPAEQDRDITERLNWIDKRNEGKHAKGTNVVPFSLHHVDELLQDIRLPLGVLTRIKHWLLPVNPGDYAGATRALLARYRKA
jgi:hypothetical protein